jgi:hypothetical protein
MAYFNLRPTLFLVTVLATFFLMMGESDTPQYFKYTAVPGFFQQDDPATVDKGFDYVCSSPSWLDQKLTFTDKYELRLDRPSL